MDVSDIVVDDVVFSTADEITQTDIQMEKDKLMNGRLNDINDNCGIFGFGETFLSVQESCGHIEISVNI